MYISVLTDGPRFHLLVDDAAGYSLRSRQRAKTVAVLPVNYAAFDVKIALDASKNKAKMAFFCLSMRRKSHF